MSSHHYKALADFHFRPNERTRSSLSTATVPTSFANEATTFILSSPSSSSSSSNSSCKKKGVFFDQRSFALQNKKKGLFALLFFTNPRARSRLLYPILFRRMHTAIDDDATTPSPFSLPHCLILWIPTSAAGQPDLLRVAQQLWCISDKLLRSPFRPPRPQGFVGELYCAPKKENVA